MSTPRQQYALNQGQKAAADGFFKFLFDDSKELIISGPAGVGKTVLMGHMIDTVMPEYLHNCQLFNETPVFTEVVMTATTNKAAEVLSLSTGRPTSTIHSFLNLKVSDDYQTGRAKLTKSNGWVVHSNKIIFIDECPMIDSPLYILLHEGTHNCKIIYVGDHNQLGPVAETISPIYRSSTPFFELTEPMRNAGQPALMEICQQLRETVETGVFKPIRIVPGVIDLLSDAEMENQVGETFQHQTQEARILAYTNERVTSYNEHVRAVRGLSDEYGVDELLVNNNAFRVGAFGLSVEEGVEITDQYPDTEFHLVEEHAAGPVNVEYRRTSIKTQLGVEIPDIRLPVNRKHVAELSRYYAGQKNWRLYFHLKNTFPEFRPRDAATVHKSQGSSHKTVFLDLGNIGGCHIPNTLARLLYVGFSRARERVVLYGRLPDKYGTLIAA